MPKMKTHSGAKKRFKVTANGKVKARHAFSSHPWVQFRLIGQHGSVFLWEAPG